MFNIEYAQIIKIRTSVSLQTTTTSESTLEPCNTRRLSASLWSQLLITWFSAGKVKHYFSVEGIIKGGDLGRILEPNYSTYSFVISINWSLYSLFFKSSCQFLPCGIVFSKPVMLKIEEEVPRFSPDIFLILSNLHVSLINPNRNQVSIKKSTFSVD